MKCGHCAAKLERQEWFCPNCKRGVRRANSATRPATRSVGLFLTTALACMVLGASLGSQWRPVEAVAAPPAPVPAVSPAPSSAPAADSSLHLTTLSAPDGGISGEARAAHLPLKPETAVQIRTVSPKP